MNKYCSLRSWSAFAEAVGIYGFNQIRAMKRVRPIGLLSFVLVMTIVPPNQNLMAKVAVPAPVSDGTRTFHGYENYVEAVNAASGQVIWRTVLYKRWKPLIRNPFLEEDVQWNIITSLNLNRNVLTVVNTKGSAYFLDALAGELVRDPIHNRKWTATVAAGSVCPKPDDIIEFKADVIPAKTHIKDFKVDNRNLENILSTWYLVCPEHWQHGYSHVAFEDRTGTIKLKDSSVISWMVRPGGLAKLTFKDGKALHLAKELTPWKRQELQLTCSMKRTRYAVGEELAPPTVTLRNNTIADINVIGPTITVIACKLVQPDKTTVPMCIAMPIGRDPRQMPPRKFKAKATMELTPTGIWYYQDASGFVPYVFRKVGDYKFWCEYEGLNSNIITITVTKGTSELTVTETPTIEKTKTAYTFLLKKVQGDNMNLVAAKDDKNLSLIPNIIQTNKLKLQVETYSNVKKGPDLCYYSKRTKEIVAIIDATKRSEKNYYLSYYLGPEGGASKEIIIEEKDEKWIVVNDDGMWSVK